MEKDNWVIQIENEIQNMESASSKKNYKGKRSIYRLSAHVAGLDNKAYKPQTVSLGPYHHGQEHLKPMEKHKRRALIHFIKRSQKPLEDYWKALAKVVHKLKDAYDQLDTKWLNDTDNAFLKLMILDGCFILEILRLCDNADGLDDYAPDDPVFSNYGKLYVLPYLKRDMLLLENQVPNLVLHTLLGVENKISEQPHEYLNKQMQRSYDTRCPPARTSLHLLQVYRWSLLYKDGYWSSSDPPERSIRRFRVCHPALGWVRHLGDVIFALDWVRRVSHLALGWVHYLEDVDDVGDGDGTMASATELYEAGIRFKKSKTKSMMDISFRSNTLSLPPIIVDEETKSRLLNLIAFELHHDSVKNEVTTYIYFLEKLVKSSKDVSLLRSRGIIISALGSDEAVAELFKSLRRDVVVDPRGSLDEMYKEVSKKLRNRLRNRLHKWRTVLVQTYFRNPWTVVILFTLTIIQTVYSVLSYSGQK